jgi:hypothetical protein
MDLCGALIMGVMSCGGQACWWYTIFNWCGCIDREHEVIQTQQPQVAQRAEPPSNPFLVNGLPKNAHLMPAYK